MEIVKVGASAGLKPHEVWCLDLWEYNTYIQACQDKQKVDTSSSILTGYYTAYYINGGKKAKDPNELIRKIYDIRTRNIV